MAEIPRDFISDFTLPFLRDPYRYLTKRCRAHDSDLIWGRIALVSGIAMTGPSAAELFYDEERFARRGIAPRRFQRTIFGEGGIQGMDGEAHRHRKRMFMSMMSPQRITQIGEVSKKWWDVYARKWAKQGRFVLYPQLCELYTRVVCEWAGTPLDESEVKARAWELTAMFDYAGSIGPKHLLGRIGRRRGERWMVNIIQQVRDRRLNLAEDSATYLIATHRDLQGQLLDPHVAAVELCNVLRPTVAVAVFITFAALALHNYPACREALRSGAEDYPYLFAQEVRRYYPFFPAVGAEVRHDFDWHGYHFTKGTPVLLDLYGTNHDKRAWGDPEVFRPERFRDWDGNPYTFVPQGGGDQNQHHRCPGEQIVIELLKVASKYLANNITYDVPSQNLEINFVRVPALPRSKFIISNVQMADAQATAAKIRQPA